MGVRTEISKQIDELPADYRPNLRTIAILQPDKSAVKHLFGIVLDEHTAATNHQGPGKVTYVDNWSIGIGRLAKRLVHERSGRADSSEAALIRAHAELAEQRSAALIGSTIARVTIVSRETFMKLPTPYYRGAQLEAYQEQAQQGMLFATGNAVALTQHGITPGVNSELVLLNYPDNTPLVSAYQTFADVRPQEAQIPAENPEGSMYWGFGSDAPAFLQWSIDNRQPDDPLLIGEPALAAMERWVDASR